MSSVLGALEGGAIGIAVGEAGATVLEPALEAPKQEAWAKSKAKILELHELATLVATTLNVLGDVQEDAYRNGYDDDALKSAIQLALRAPGPPEAGKLWLRAQGDYPGAITQDQLFHAYGKAGLEGQWWAALRDADANQLLTPAQIALGIIRSTVKDDGLLVVANDLTDPTVSGGGSASGTVEPITVKAYVPATIDPLKEAAAAGINADRLRAMVGSIGLPPSVQQLASAYWRGLATKGTFYQGIQEGDARPEWADLWLEESRQILTPHDYMELALRGYYDVPTGQALAAQHGMSAADSKYLYDVLGRSVSVHQIVTGEARGGVFNGPTDQIPQAFLESLQRGNLRPEYYNIAYANRQTIPGYFVLEALLKAGAVKASEKVGDLESGEWYFTALGWPPALAKAAADLYASSAATTTSTAVKSAQTKLRTAAEKAYINGASTPQQATDDLVTAGVAADDVPTILTAWDRIIAIEKRTTTPATVIAPPAAG